MVSTRKLNIARQKIELGQIGPNTECILPDFLNYFIVSSALVVGLFIFCTSFSDTVLYITVKGGFNQRA